MKIFFIRHGESEANARRIIGTAKTPLTEMGVLQAKYAGLQIDTPASETVIIASPFTRAQQTAQYVAETHKPGATIYTEPEIRERSFGNLNKHASFDLREIPGYVDKSGKLSRDWTPPGGESIDDVAVRAYPAVISWVEKHPNKNLVFVSHGHTIRALAGIFLGGWEKTNALKNGEVLQFAAPSSR